MVCCCNFDIGQFDLIKHVCSESIVFAWHTERFVVEIHLVYMADDTYRFVVNIHCVHMADDIEQSAV